MADDHLAKVADEQARNLRYRQRLQQRHNQRTQRALNGWSVQAPDVDAIIGRVGLTERWDAIDDDSFYIGPTHVETDDLKVYSWAADVAHAFFGTKGYPELDGKVQVTRVFRHRFSDIVDFETTELTVGPHPRSSTG